MTSSQFENFMQSPFASDNMRKTADYFPVDVSKKYYPHPHEIARFRTKTTEEGNNEVLELKQPRNSWRDTDFFKRMTFAQLSENSSESGSFYDNDSKSSSSLGSNNDSNSSNNSNSDSVANSSGFSQDNSGSSNNFSENSSNNQSSNSS
jgi:hypothetical protein